MRGCVLGGAAGKFTAALEVREQRQLLLSFLQHMVVQRRVRNPFEDDNVAGIVNYVNIGLQVTGGQPRGTLPSGDPRPPVPEMRCLPCGLPQGSPSLRDLCLLFLPGVPFPSPQPCTSVTLPSEPCLQDPHLRCLTWGTLSCKICKDVASLGVPCPTRCATTWPPEGDAIPQVQRDACNQWKRTR